MRTRVAGIVIALACTSPALGWVQLGDGYDSVSRRPRGVCVSAATPPAAPTLTGSDFAGTVREVRTASQFRKELGLTAEIEARGLTYSGSFSSSFYSTHEINETSLNLLISAEYATASRLTNPMIKREMRGMSGEDFLFACGDRFVDEVEWKAQLLILIVVNTRTEADRSALSGKLGVSGGPVKLGVTMQKKIESVLATSSLSLDVRAIGIDSIPTPPSKGELSDYIAYLNLFMKEGKRSTPKITGFHARQYRGLKGAPSRVVVPQAQRDLMNMFEGIAASSYQLYSRFDDAVRRPSAYFQDAAGTNFRQKRDDLDHYLQDVREKLQQCTDVPYECASDAANTLSRRLESFKSLEPRRAPYFDDFDITSAPFTNPREFVSPEWQGGDCWHRAQIKVTADDIRITPDKHIIYPFTCEGTSLAYKCGSGAWAGGGDFRAFGRVEADLNVGVQGGRVENAGIVYTSLPAGIPDGDLKSFKCGTDLLAFVLSRTGLLTTPDPVPATPFLCGGDKQEHAVLLGSVPLSVISAVGRGSACHLDAWFKSSFPAGGFTIGLSGATDRGGLSLQVYCSGRRDPKDCSAQDGGRCDLSQELDRATECFIRVQPQNASSFQLDVRVRQ